MSDSSEDVITPVAPPAPAPAPTPAPAPAPGAGQQGANANQAPANVRKKIKIAYIGEKRSRQVTFLKRKNGILKKGYEGVLSKPRIAIIIMNRDNGKLFQYSNESMAEILIRYANFNGPSEIRRKEDFANIAAARGNTNIPVEQPAVAQAAMAAAAKARKLDCKCPCTCGTQEGAEKAQRNLPLVDRTNKQEVRAEPSQPNTAQQQAVQPSLPTPHLPQFSTAAVQAASHPTQVPAAVERFTPARPVLQASVPTPEAPVIVAPNTADIEAAEILGISPTTAEQASDKMSEPQIPAQGEYSGFLAPHLQGVMPAQAAIGTVVPPQGMLGSRVNDLGTVCEDIAVVNTDSVQPVAPGMALPAEIEVQPRASMEMNMQENGEDQYATTTDGLWVHTQHDMGGREGEHVDVATEPNGAEAGDEIFPDQQTWELPEQDVGLYQESVEQMEPNEIANPPPLVPWHVDANRADGHNGGPRVVRRPRSANLTLEVPRPNGIADDNLPVQIADNNWQGGGTAGHADTMPGDMLGGTFAPPLQQMPQFTPQSGMSWGPMQSALPSQLGFPMQPGLPNPSPGVESQVQMMGTPFTPTGHHSYAQIALGTPTNPSFLQGPFSGIPTPPSGNAFVGGGFDANFVTGQGGTTHSGLVPGENYGPGGTWVPAKTEMNSSDVGRAEAEVAHAAEFANERARTEAVPLEMRHAYGQRKRSANNMGVNTLEGQRRQRRRR